MPKRPTPCHVPLTPKLARSLHTALLAFYRAQAKDLPWRRSCDPWAIWVSEVMLQQTQVQTVVPRFAPFLRAFPSAEAMAAAQVSEVCEAWAGLGYYRRARSLHAAAQQVVQEHGSEVPNTVEALLKLKGVGRYTAGAIASIAFGQAAPIVDGNVVRVLGRILRQDATLATPAGTRQLWALATTLVEAGPARDAGAFNQAMMELGRTVCTPKAPACLLCPVRTLCGAYAAGAQLQYPTPVPRPKKQPLQVVFAWRQDAAGLWLWQRPVAGLWAGLWEMPSAQGDTATQTLGSRGIRVGPPICQVTHLLTHRAVTAVVCRGEGTAADWRTAGAAPVAAPMAAPLSALAVKAIVAARASMV